MHSYELRIDYITLLQELGEFSEQSIITRNLFKALGSFWEDYYPDLETAIQGANGVVTLQSDIFSQLLDICLSSSILDIPYQYQLQQELFLFQEDKLETVYNEQGDLEYYSIPIDGFKDINYIVSSIFEPSVILESGTDFEVVGDELRLFVDLFNDSNIFDFTFRSESTYSSHVVLWGINVLLDTYYIYNRYGRFLFRKEPDSEGYKYIVLALTYFFVNTKSVYHLEAVLNIQFGAPFSRVIGEQVLDISEDIEADDLKVDFLNIQQYKRITTTHNEYYSPFFFEILVEVGDILENYQLLSRFHEVKDYISDPEWYDGSPFPLELVESVEAPDFGNQIRGLPYYLYDTEYSYNDSIVYSGNYESFQEWRDIYDREQLRNFRIYKDKDGWLKYFYDLMDQVLKHNTFYLGTRITFETYEYFDFVREVLLKYLWPGIPVYLYPVLDNTLFVLNTSEINVEEENEIDLAYTENSEYEVSEKNREHYDGSFVYWKGGYSYGLYNTLWGELNNTLSYGRKESYPGSYWRYSQRYYSYDGSNYYIARIGDYWYYDYDRFLNLYSGDYTYDLVNKYIDIDTYDITQGYTEINEVTDSDTNIDIEHNLGNSNYLSNTSTDLYYNNSTTYTGDRDYRHYNTLHNENHVEVNSNISSIYPDSYWHYNNSFYKFNGDNFYTPLVTSYEYYNSHYTYNGEIDYDPESRYIDLTAYELIQSIIDQVKLQDQDNSIQLNQDLDTSNYLSNTSTDLYYNNSTTYTGDRDYRHYNTLHNENHVEVNSNISSIYPDSYWHYNNSFYTFNGDNFYTPLVTSYEYYDSSYVYNGELDYDPESRYIDLTAYEISNSFNDNFGHTSDVLSIQEVTDLEYNSLLEYEGVRDFQ